MNDGTRDDLETSGFLNVIIKKGWYIAITLIAVMAPIVYYNFTAEPVYESNTTIIYDEPSMSMVNNVQYDFKRRETLLNLIQEIQSRSLALEIVNSLPSNALRKIPLPELVEDGFDKTAYYAAKIRKNIQANPVAESDVIQIKVHSKDAYNAMVIANAITNVLKKRNVRLMQEEVSGVRGQIEEQWQLYKNKLEAAENALRQYKVRNEVTSLEKETEELLHRVSQVEALYQTTKADRSKTEERLATVNKKIQSQKENIIPSYADASTPFIQQLREDFDTKKRQYIRQQLLGVPETNSKMIQIKQDLEQLRNNLAEETRKLAEKENIIDPLSQMAMLYEEKISLELEFETLRTQERSLANAIREYESELKYLPSKEYKLARLTRERDIAQEIFSTLSLRREEARIREAERIGSIRVIDKAELPGAPIKPKKRLNLAIGFILGLTIGVGLAFFLESIDTSLKTPEEVESKTGMTIIGTIPKFRSSLRQAKYQQNDNNKNGLSNTLITKYMPNSPISEAYRALRTNIQFAHKSENLRTLMLTSSGPKEGKSTTSCNLGVVTAQMGLKTLLIDADLRKPTLHTFFGMQKEPGLADILSYFISNDQSDYINERNSDQENKDTEKTDRLGTASIRARRAVQEIASLDLAIAEAVRPTKIKSMDVLTCGRLPANPSEVLSSDTMKDLLELVKERYEFVIIDAPPIIAVTDAAVLSPYVDGIGLVIESGRNEKEIILKAKGVLDRVGVNIVGAVLNNIREKNLYGDYNYYYTYYANQHPGKRGSG